MFSVDIAGLLAMRQRIQDVIDALPTLLEQAVYDVAEEAVTILHDECPYDGELDNGQIPGEEGHLNDSFFVQDVDYGIVTEVEIMTSEKLKLSYVTGGTDGPIIPVSQHAMWWPALSHPVTQVQGQAANDFVTPARDILDSTVPDIIQPVIDLIITSLEL
jgi:hypothetical protein